MKVVSVVKGCLNHLCLEKQVLFRPVTVSHLQVNGLIESIQVQNLNMFPKCFKCRYTSSRETNKQINRKKLLYFKNNPGWMFCCRKSYGS